MALIKCHECGTEVSTEAKACQKCGAKVKKPASGVAKLLLGFVVIIIVASMAGVGSNTASTPETPEQKAQKEAETARYAVAAATSKLLREAMRDPESLVFETLRVNDDATIVCAEYRARNGFGGMNREHITVTKTKTSQSATDWNKHCTKAMYDMLWAAK